MAAEQASRKRASKTHYVEEHTSILEPQSKVRYPHPDYSEDCYYHKARYHHRYRPAPIYEYRTSTSSSPSPPPYQSSKEGSYDHSGEVILKEQLPPYPRGSHQKVDYVLMSKRPQYQVAKLLPYSENSPGPLVQATTTCAGSPPASVNTETLVLQRAESQTSQSVPVLEEDGVLQDEEEAVSSSDAEEPTLSDATLASDVTDVQSPLEDLKSYKHLILQIAKVMDLAVEQPASVESDMVFGDIDQDQAPPAQLRFIPTLLKVVKESWAAPSSQAQIPRRVENLYRTHGADTEFLQKHPCQNSFIVGATQNRARNRFASVPPDKESKKLDRFGRRFYSLASFVLQTANCVAAMGAYHHFLLNKLLPFLNMLPEDNRQRALAYHQEAMTISRQERIATRHIVDAAAKQSMKAIALRRHAWLRSSNIPEYARIRIQDLPFDGVGLFDPKTDEMLVKLQKLTKTAQDYIAQSYNRSPRQYQRRRHTYQPYRASADRPGLRSRSSPLQPRLQETHQRSR